MLQGKARIKEQGTFRERKAARTAKGQVKYEFQVYLSSYLFERELIATFKSRKEAEEFAFKQRGPIVGNSAAVRTVWDRHSYKASGCHSGHFKIERAEVPNDEPSK